MCTVTFAADNQRTFITSNRDEHVLRPAIPPKIYEINGKQLLFPKDPRAGGTWFATDEFSNVAVLLNGGFEKHVPVNPYRRSRGLVVLDLISSDIPVHCWKAIDLEQIEPFTIILFVSHRLYELVWDGLQKHLLPLDVAQKYIWSSSTLYSKNVRQQRQQLFNDHVNDGSKISAKRILDFHKNADLHDHENGLVIDRCGKLKTLTITQAIVKSEATTVMHDDLINKTQTVQQIQHLQKKLH